MWPPVRYADASPRTRDAPAEDAAMESSFPVSPDDADVVYHALRYYASELLDSFVADDESEMLDDAVHAKEIADRLQLWLVANRQALVRDAPRERRRMDHGSS